MHVTLSLIEYQFERYRFLRNQPQMRLYRTTLLTPFTALNWRRRQYLYADIAPVKPLDRTKPPDWYFELQQKAAREYFPQLPSPLTIEGIRLVFYNQYNPKEVAIYGVNCGIVFGLTLRVDTATTVDNRPWDAPVWCYSRDVDVQAGSWSHIWNLVNDNKTQLIGYWDWHYTEIVKQFNPLYDNLF